MKIIEDAIKRGADNLSEFESKQVLSVYGIPVTREKTAKTLEEAVSVANSIGYPVVLKASGENLQHKTELDLIRLDLKDESQVRLAYNKLLAESAIPITEVLVQQMLRGNRELMAGLKRDNQFGPCVVFGLGGVLAELLIALGRIGLENDAVAEIDINPIKLIEGRPVAVDALIILKMVS